MGFLKKIFGGKDENIVISSYADFWNWFKRHEKSFFKTVKDHEKVDEDFLRKLTPLLRQLSEDFYCVTGMVDDNTAELIISTDGIIKEFVFAEDFVAAAPVYVWAASLGEFKGMRASSYYDAACCFALSNQPDSAFKYLSKAKDLGWSNKTHLLKDSDLSSLHGTQQWDEFTNSMTEQKN